MYQRYPAKNIKAGGKDDHRRRSEWRWVNKVKGGEKRTHLDPHRHKKEAINHPKERSRTPNISKIRPVPNKKKNQNAGELKRPKNKKGEPMNGRRSGKIKQRAGEKVRGVHKSARRNAKKTKDVKGSPPKTVATGRTANGVQTPRNLKKTPPNARGDSGPEQNGQCPKRVEHLLLRESGQVNNRRRVKGFHESTPLTRLHPNDTACQASQQEGEKKKPTEDSISTRMRAEQPPKGLHVWRGRGLQRIGSKLTGKIFSALGAARPKGKRWGV